MNDRRFPNLFVIGAMKSGTTSLHRLLGQHPEIFMSEYKEPQYFAGVQHQRRHWFDTHPLPDPQGRWYFQLFEPANADPRIRYAGESSADYTQRPVFEGCAQRIAKHNPEARLIYIVRDPIERSIAHYWHEVRGHTKEMRPPLQAMREEPVYTAFSDYAYQLQPYMECFPRDRIYVLTLESLRDRHDESLRGIFEWLGVDAGVTIPKTRANTRPELNYHARPGWLWLARLPLESRLWRKATRFLPQKFHSALHRMSHRPVRPDEYDFDEVKEYLRPILAEKIKAFSELLGRDFPEWRTTFPPARAEAAATSAVPAS